jgi:hypothetical protein
VDLDRLSRGRRKRSLLKEETMHFESSWHAQGLRWIGSLFSGAADFLDRPSREAAPAEHAAPHPAEDFIDDTRFRMHMRGL